MIYYGHDLHFMREFREYELTGDVKKRQESEYWKSIEFSLFHKVAVSYLSVLREEEAIHAVDETIPVKAITAYVYEEFLQNLNKDFAKREGCASVAGGFETRIRIARLCCSFQKEVFGRSGNRSRSSTSWGSKRLGRDQSAGTAWKWHHRQRFCK